MDDEIEVPVDALEAMSEDEYDDDLGDGYTQAATCMCTNKCMGGSSGAMQS